MKSIEGGKDKERDWKDDVTLDGNLFLREVIDSFNRQYGLSLSRIPLVNFEGAVKEHYILLLMQVFAHLFTGFAGADTETEEKFMADMKHWFATARMELLKIKETPMVGSVDSGPKPVA